MQAYSCIWHSWSGYHVITWHLWTFVLLLSLMGESPCMWILNKGRTIKDVCSGKHSQGSVPPPVEEGSFAPDWCSGVLQAQNKAGLLDVHCDCTHTCSVVSLDPPSRSLSATQMRQIQRELSRSSKELYRMQSGSCRRSIRDGKPKASSRCNPLPQLSAGLTNSQSAGGDILVGSSGCYFTACFSSLPSARQTLATTETYQTPYHITYTTFW